MTTTNLKVLRNDVEWATRFDGEISEVEINGRKINDVHDLTSKVEKMTKTIHYLAWISTSLGVMAVATILWLIYWLHAHDAEIEELLLTSGDDYTKLKADANEWRSHKRHRAFVTLNKVLEYQWNNDTQDWEPSGNHASKRN